MINEQKNEVFTGLKKICNFCYCQIQFTLKEQITINKQKQRMSFYDPLTPVFQATRVEIERTIMGLQQRLLRRKELDLQMERDLIQQQSLQRLRHRDLLYDPLDRGYSAQVELQKRMRELRTFDPRENLMNNYAQRQSLELDYLARLRQIQRQQLSLDQQYRINPHSGQKQAPYYMPEKQYHNDQRVNPLEESGEMLARKYFDGTRAYEYNEQLKRSGDKQPHFDEHDHSTKDYFKKQQLFNQTIRNNKNQQQQPDHSTVKKYEPSAEKEINHKKQYESDHKSFIISRQSPIKQIQLSSKYNSTSNKMPHENYQNQHERLNYHQPIHEKSQQNFSNDNSPQLKPKDIQRSRTKSTQPTNQLILIPEGTYSRQSRSKSRPKSSTKTSQYLSNRQKSSHSLHYHSATKSTLPLLSEQLPIDQKFKLWFRQMSRLAEQAKQVYEIKYAKNLPEYLMTVCEKEDKFRKELKEKICKIPIVERNYDVGPVNQ